MCVLGIPLFTSTPSVPPNLLMTLGNHCEHWKDCNKWENRCLKMSCNCVSSLIFLIAQAHIKWSIHFNGNYQLNLIVLKCWDHHLTLDVHLQKFTWILAELFLYNFIRKILCFIRGYIRKLLFFKYAILYLNTLILYGGLDSEESTCNVGDLGSIPGLGRSPGGGYGNTFQYSCLENPVDRGAWRATVHGM